MRAACEALTNDRPGTFVLASGAIVNDVPALLAMFGLLAGRAATEAEIAELRAKVEVQGR